MLLLSAFIIEIPMHAFENRDNTIKTTIISNCIFKVDESKTDKESLAYIEQNKYYYINPNDGVVCNGERAFPLVKSTDLEYFDNFIVQGNAMDKNSVAISEVFSRSNGVELGDTIKINNSNVIVTNIVNSNEYSGQVIYISKENFKAIYVNTGTTYYISNNSL